MASRLTLAPVFASPLARFRVAMVPPSLGGQGIFVQRIRMFILKS